MESINVNVLKYPNAFDYGVDMIMYTARPQSAKVGFSRKRWHPPTRKVTYRVGYTWNRGGRLKELRIRHLARKFLHVWIQKTFGQITISQARSFYRNVLLRKTLRAWRDEWWHARREWTLTIRADCHYKYVLYSKVYQAWREYVSVQEEEKRKLLLAFKFVGQRRLRLAWDGWELYVEMQHLKRRMQEAAVKHQTLTTARTGLPPKKSVSFNLPEDQSSRYPLSPAKKHTAGNTQILPGDSIADRLLQVRASRLQPRRPDDLLHSPAKQLTQHPLPSSLRTANASQTDLSAPIARLPAPPDQPQAPVSPPSTQLWAPALATCPPVLCSRPAPTVVPATQPSPVSQDILLPPSSFTASSKTSSRHKDSLLLTPHDFTHHNLSGQGVFKSGTLDEEGDDLLTQSACEPTEALTEELLEIQLHLQRYQQERNQLQAWRKLQKVMTNWLQTTGSDGETEERGTIIQELSELESRISALSVKLTEQKPTMICHAARVQSIASQLLGSSAPT
ncbi:uncharacterized protein sfi1 isoform X2 [Brachyhypopomus gauderio]|uniref:uncharacterized protein sfi1 isoform X2 n=1 Tax=Brachyhypopomus gauderio TaxID=698409 RepID=UPI0040430C61